MPAHSPTMGLCLKWPVPRGAEHSLLPGLFPDMPCSWRSEQPEVKWFAFQKSKAAMPF